MTNGRAFGFVLNHTCPRSSFALENPSAVPFALLGRAIPAKILIFLPNDASFLAVSPFQTPRLFAACSTPFKHSHNAQTTPQKHPLWQFLVNQIHQQRASQLSLQPCGADSDLPGSPLNPKAGQPQPNPSASPLAVYTCSSHSRFPFLSFRSKRGPVPHASSVDVTRSRVVRTTSRLGTSLSRGVPRRALKTPVGRSIRD